MGTELWLPDNLLKEEQVEHDLALGRYWSRALQGISPHLSLVLAKDSAEPPLIPGRWHIRRKNQGAPDSYIPIVGRDGEYREPDASVMDEIHRRDSWRTPGWLDKFLEEKRADEDTRRKDRELRQEQLKDEAAADFRAARRIPGEDVERKSKRRREA